MANLIEQFYKAFQDLDAEKMAELYHLEVEFEDPAFGRLKGNRAKNMWRMLCANSSDLEISYSNIKIESGKGSANWEAKYIFSKTKRRIHNRINAEFDFKEGKIIKHRDNFNLHKWASQAFGLKGFLLGWTQIFKSKLNSETNKLLELFERRNRLTTN